MNISALDMFSIGIGPSSSHTVGPMRAAMKFARRHCLKQGDTATVHITLHGSLAATGVGHGTDRATLLGLVGYTPTTVTPDIDPAFGTVIPLQGEVKGPNAVVQYKLHFDPLPLPEHPNALTFMLFDADGARVSDPEVFFSIGGGFIAEADTFHEDATTTQSATIPYPFGTAAELLNHCAAHALSIPELTLANEVAIHGSEAVVFQHLDTVWETMKQCVNNGMRSEGILPGGLDVRRRAPGLKAQLLQQGSPRTDPLWAMEWVNLYALAVNEENAAGGTVVTAPTNGAAGIVPAVMHYLRDFGSRMYGKRHRDFLLTAAAIGMIIKENASISGAEVGCQGEVGSASAMAAAGLCQLLGGTPEQVEHAAEIALEHNLGLTCDPVGGLVQIPCIERNAVGAVKSINAARLSMRNMGGHRVSLDDVVRTMAATGFDMHNKYKETSTGGLAVHLGLPVSITEC
ncbi:L-serine ammonia-lyase [Corynebacterium gerontici]|uniref:L-serine dehydratase n=1 Tax=Corynebacterium gerontici TaxID=2079234 RepID=A0A3G6J698_9CORY|nr:L-serine ammonia-lyase [Corynebacterium gerontici]AZA11534.1 L-serine dehydratase 2 [Corynebacterium gerontici]